MKGEEGKKGGCINSTSLGRKISDILGGKGMVIGARARIGYSGQDGTGPWPSYLLLGDWWQWPEIRSYEGGLYQASSCLLLFLHL